MPPASSIPNENQDRLLPEHRSAPIGPIIGIVIIVVLMLLGALYFWGAQLNRASQNPPPYIPPQATGVSQ